MPKRISKRPKRPSDPSLLARQIIEEATGAPLTPNTPQKLKVTIKPVIDKATISAVMATLGRKGGKIGGKRRLETMSDEERSIAAAKAAKARWNKKKRDGN